MTIGISIVVHQMILVCVCVCAKSSKDLMDLLDEQECTVCLMYIFYVNRGGIEVLCMQKNVTHTKTLTKEQGQHCECSEI